jgi:hypothetical protein
MQIWTPKEIGKAVAICNAPIDQDINHIGTIEVDTKGNTQLEHGTIIIVNGVI